MAVFVCCADESSDGQQATDFFYGGYAATVDTWDNDFSPAWNERVRQGPPQLEYLHMSELLREEWRIKHGVTVANAEYRKREAGRVIASSGGLIPVICHMSQTRFKRDILPFAPKGRHTALELPDYISFLAFSFSALAWLHTHRRDEVERVDFWVEENQKISTRLHRMHDRVAENLTELGRADLAGLVGTFLPVPKDRVQAQVADFVCWHERHAKNDTLDREGQRRRHALVHDREGIRTDIDSTMLDEFAQTLRDTFPVARKAKVI
jgi:hypothetical protein